MRTSGNSGAEVTGPIEGVDGSHDTDEFLLVADQIAVRASWGPIFGPTDVAIRPGGVTVLEGSVGRGRTALLLTLAGRMTPTSGRLTAFGRTNDARRLFANAAIADIDEVDGIDQTIRVRDVVTEQIRWQAPWFRWVGQSTPEDLERLCRPVFGPLTLPHLDSFVEELPELTGALFRIAMANLKRPPLLVTGGVDRMTRTSNTDKLLERLVDLGREQTVITADVNGVHRGLGVRQVLRVDNLTDDEFARIVQEDRI